MDLLWHSAERNKDIWSLHGSHLILKNEQKTMYAYWRWEDRGLGWVGEFVWVGEISLFTHHGLYFLQFIEHHELDSDWCIIFGSHFIDLCKTNISVLYHIFKQWRFNLKLISQCYCIYCTYRFCTCTYMKSW